MERQKISWRALKLEEKEIDGGVVRKQHNLESRRPDMVGSEKNRTRIRSKSPSSNHHEFLLQNIRGKLVEHSHIRDIRDVDCRCTKQFTCDWIIKKFGAVLNMIIQRWDESGTVVFRERSIFATSTLGSLPPFSGTMKVIVRYCPAFPHCDYRIALVLEQVRMVRGRG
ncbi:hypothetical protein BDP27DRAFT_1329290 [Rhodocollybia butyracea]|uniref:Uncharacterized protein n=1 Tax=Rhodocollybia butyracea TaxID=206335 RepID=A0A9P5PK86_9AGAR|nr:hypothetical protein BDP27DRAFT_1329290 [Rhodocollybia butyracea]